MKPREYTPDELKRLHEEQVQAAVPLVLRVWTEMQAEQKGGNSGEQSQHASRGTGAELPRVG